MSDNFAQFGGWLLAFILNFFVRQINWKNVTAEVLEGDSNKDINKSCTFFFQRDTATSPLG